MSAKSKNSPRTTAGAADRAFDPAILDRARNVAARYQVILRNEEGHWFGRGVELPDAHEDGTTPDECVAKCREMFVTVVAYMLEQGQVPPASADDAKRTVQLNVRFTPTEKFVLEAAARRSGLGISDYVRDKALSRG
jgi:predicted RNase H-like HicB family nuclease